MTEQSIGTIIYALVKPMFKIYFILGLGYYLAKRNILTVLTCRDISDMIVTAIMPCLVFNNLVSNLKLSDIKDLGIIFFTAICLFGVGVLLATLTYFLTKAPRRWLGGLLSVGLFPNISDMPIAYLQTMSKGGLVISEHDGARGIAYVCIFVAAQIALQFSCGLFRLVEMDFTRDIDLNLLGTGSKSTADDEEKRTETTASDLSSLRSLILGPSVQRSETQPQQFLNQISSNTSVTTSVRERRRSSVSEHPHETNLQMLPSRVVVDRLGPSEDINDVIHEFSDYTSVRNREIERVVTHGEAALILSTPKQLLTDVAADDGASVHAPTRNKYLQAFINWCKTMGQNLRAPNSVALILGIAIAMAPPLKALFVPVEHPHIPTAPDKQPPLSFFMDIVSYIGAASVPLGLLLLGATISRLQVKKMPPGFWKTALMITAARLIILPIFGVGLTTGLVHGGWYEHDALLRFVLVIEFGMPLATVLVFFTAFYTDPELEDHLQMDCLAVCLIFQYAIFWLTLPFLVTFTFMVSMR